MKASENNKTDEGLDLNFHAPAGGQTMKKRMQVFDVPLAAASIARSRPKSPEVPMFL
ncbi:MAG: hypothetical protein H7346_09665 [Burkholderiaceae bacterium]|nr:hypothetical protein [Burkholderiaceae bacterium]